MSKVTEVHIFKAGPQTSAQGVERTFTKKDLAQVAESYNQSIHDAPIVIGHEMSDKTPSWGWVKGVKLKGDNLYAEVEFTPQMGEYINDGLYKKVSASFYAPESKINPSPGNWSLRHVAMLGGQPPAVKGLQGFAYSETDEHTFNFATATGEVKLSPEQVFDEELGPTLKSEKQPLEYLKDQLEEARTEMAAEEKEKAEAQATLEEMDVEGTSEEEGAEFAEEDKKVDPKKKKAPAGEQGAEDAEEEEEGEDTLDNKEGCGSKKKGASYKEEDDDTADHAGCGSKKKGASYKEDEDEASHKEKMDPVGKEDGDVDNDGDKDSSDEYLKKRREAIAKSKKDTSDNSEIVVPEGMDAAQWEAGFKDAVDQYYAGAQEGADEVVHQETEDQTADYLAGIEAGFEFAQVRLNRDLGSATHDTKCCDADEEAEGEGPVASKVKKNAKVGESECCPEGDNNFEEGLNEVNSDKKRGKDGVKSTKVADGEDEVANAESEDKDFGRDKVGKADEAGKSRRKEKGTGKSHDEVYDGKTSAKAPDQDRAKKGTAPDQDRAKTGKSKDVQSVPGTEYKHVSGAPGSGKAIKSPAVRVMKFSEAQFSELSERLEQLEAMNAKLVAEKQAAEAKAHRMQLEEFAESLYATGRLTDATIEQDELVDYMEGLENGTLEFSEGETPATKLMELLAALPQQVSFSEIAPHNVDAMPIEDLDPHEKALRLSKESEMSYTEALKQTLFSAE